MTNNNQATAQEFRQNAVDKSAAANNDVLKISYKKSEEVTKTKEEIVDAKTFNFFKSPAFHAARRY